MATRILGNGIYGMGEAAFLLGMSRRRIRAWFNGWQSYSGSRLLESDYHDLDEQAISFLDLVDAAVALTLRHKHHVSSLTIRKLRERLSQRWNTPHPFSRETFYTDERGKQVFCTLTELAEINGETHLLEILTSQHTIADILLPFLSRVEYDRSSRYAQVFKLTDRVVLDPRRKFGKPTVRGTGMLTHLLHQCYLATGSYEHVADWYNVSPLDVEAAVLFEQEFAGIAA